MARPIISETVELLSGSNVFKQGDDITLSFQIRNHDKSIKDLEGATAYFLLADKDAVVLERNAEIVGDVINVNFTNADTQTGNGNMRLELHITEDGETRKFPSDGFIGIRITPTLDDLEVGGVPYFTFEAFVEEYNQIVADTKEEMKADVVELQKSKVDLEQRGINVLNTGVVADGTDQSIPFQNALNVAESLNRPVIIPPTTSQYLLNSSITIPKGVHLISNGAVINFRDTLTLLGENQISGFIFDGGWSIKGNGIQIEGKGCKILYNTFKNMKASSTNQTNMINFNGFGDSLIFGNVFDGIKPYSDTGTDGTNEIVARAIRIYNAENITIENNIFKNMEAYKDGDYIHVLSTVLNNPVYPFQGIANGCFTRLNGIKITNNTFYQSLNKASVKIQASGVIVKDNEFVLDYNALGGQMYSVVRFHNIRDGIFKNNKILVKGSKLVYLVLGEYSDNLTIKGNKFYFDSPITYDVDSVSRMFSFVSVKRLKWKNNEIHANNVKEIFRLDGCKLAEINGNDVNYSFNDKTTNLLVLSKSQSGITNENIMLKGNAFSADSTAKLLNTSLSDVNNLVIEENDFDSVKCGSFVLSNCNGATIINNRIPNSDIYAVSLYAGCNNIQLVRNKYGSNLASIFRINNNATHVKSIANDTENTPIVFNTGGSTQNYSELEYQRGMQALEGYDYGWTSARPTTKKQIGYTYYDRNLSKKIFWDGTNWTEILDSRIQYKVDYGTEPPTTGIWNKMDRRLNTDVFAGGYEGWMCVESGEFGTIKEPVFKPFGLISE